MRFGAIQYLNLLPFYVFMKQNLRTNSSKKLLFYKRGVPSKINSIYKKKKVDCAFISSIRSQNENCSNLGIVARKEVLSVISIRGQEIQDIESETSNNLANVLNIKGKVLIGDKALKYWFDNNSTDSNIEDLALTWQKRHHNLPFVFARLCFNREYNNFYKILFRKFSNTKVRIPFYVLKQKADKLGITTDELKLYFTKISYKIDKKASKSLKIFFREVDKKNKII